MDRLFRQKLLGGCSRNHDERSAASTGRLGSSSPASPITRRVAMNRTPTRHGHNQTPPSISVSNAEFPCSSSLSQPPPPMGSPCPAICSWPAPPQNPRNELKPTAVAMPLSMAGPSTASVRSSASTTIPPQSASPMHLSPQPPSPVPRLDPQDENNIRLLSMLRAVTANSAPPGAASPGGHWGRETELRQKIQALEEIVAEYERQKFSVLGNFTDFRERVAERERRLEAEYSHKIIDLSEEVLGAKREFEERMKSFQILQEQFEREKEQALEKLRQDHAREIQAMEQRFSQSQLLNLEQKYVMEIQRLEEERKALRADRERLGEEFEMKLRRAESLFGTELTAAKMLYTRELRVLREHEEALKDELAVRQEEFHDRFKELQLQSRQAKDELGHCREEVTHLERALREKAAQIQRLAGELAQARHKTEQAVRQLDEARAREGEGERELARQRAELERKAEQLEEAEGTRLGLERTVKELRTEVKALHNKVDLLEVERDGLKAQGESQTKLHDSQLTALEAMLKSVTDDKEGCAERCKELLDSERAEAEEREMALRREFSSKLGELEEQYNGLREHVEQDSEHFGPENQKLWEEIECLRAEKSELEGELISARKGARALPADELEKLSRSIQLIEKSAGIGDEEEEEEEEVCLKDLLDKLSDLERGVEGIVREKEQMKAKLEMMLNGETDGWTRAFELESELQRKGESHKREVERLEAEMAKLSEKAEMKESGGHLERELADMKEKAEELETELRETEELLERTRDEAEEEIRRAEEEHVLTLERKMSALNTEHERTVELMQQREQEMEGELAALRARLAADDGLRTEGGTQTETQGTGAEEELRRTREQLRERDQLIDELREQLASARAVDEAKKESRSQSIASAPEHLAMCQKAENRPANLNAETEFALRKECRRHDHWRRLEATVPQDLSPPQPNSSQRSLLSPTDGKSCPQQQRISPSRQMFFGAKSGEASAGRNGSGSGGGGERRPAWKF